MKLSSIPQARRWFPAIPMLLLTCAATVDAQTVLDARTAQFSPSIDHDATVDGNPVVTSYRLHIYQAGSTQVVQAIELGKPAPEPDGLIRVDFRPLLTAPLIPGIEYEARAVAVGPGGSTASELSNRFADSVICAPTLSSAGTSMAAAGGVGSVAVSAAAGCAWTAASNAPWLTVTAGSTGAGSGHVAFSAAANPSSSGRTGTLAIAGQTFTVVQAGASCTYTISPATRSATASPETATVAVTAPGGCGWTATSSAAWLTVASGSSGSGSGSATVQVAANTASTDRIGAVMIAGHAFTVTQAGAACTYAVTPATVAAPAAGLTVALAVATTPGCTWSAGALPSWIVPVGATSGTGPGTLSLAVAPNASTSRSANVVVAGESVALTQSGGAPPPPPGNLRVVPPIPR